MTNDLHTRWGSAFELKIALLNAVPYTIVAGGVTYLDGQLAHHVVEAYRSRSYALGPWIMLAGVPIFLLTWLPLLRMKRSRISVLWPGVVMLLALVLTLLNFRPPFPHDSMTAWTLLLGATSTLTGAVRYLSEGVDRAVLASMPQADRQGHVRECSAFWRTTAIGLLAVYVPIMITALQQVWEIANRITTDKPEVFRVNAFGTASVHFFTLILAVGPVYECLRASYMAVQPDQRIKPHRDTK
jgi:hypothetical protein